MRLKFLFGNSLTVIPSVAEGSLHDRSAKDHSTPLRYARDDSFGIILRLRFFSL